MVITFPFLLLVPVASRHSGCFASCSLLNQKMQYFNIAGTNMATSPLPDSTALEAGILEDERPSRLSRVHDNVRELLRTSVFGSVASSPTSPVHRNQNAVSSLPPVFLAPSAPDAALRSHPPSPVFGHHVPGRPAEALPSPTESTASDSTAATAESVHSRARCIPGSYYRNIQRMAHQSTVFNTRAVAALNHPDLSDPSLEDLTQQKAQRRHHRGWVRSRSGDSTSTGSSSSHRSSHGKSRRRRVASKAVGSQGLFCVLAALLLAALVATCMSSTFECISLDSRS